MCDLGIIGGGPAGYTAAEHAAKLGLTVYLFERNEVGGVCLNEGCIPTKTLLYSDKLYDHALHAAKYGVAAEGVAADYGKMAARKNKVVRKLVAGVRARLNHRNITLVKGDACIAGRNDKDIAVECGGTRYLMRNLLVCTGSHNAVPPIPGIDGERVWSSREALAAKERPASVAIIGGGVIGMEFASLYNMLGTEVAVIEMQDEILPQMDREVSRLLREELARRGVTFHLQSRVLEVRGDEVLFEQEGETHTVRAERILLSVGRRPSTKGFGLETLHLDMTPGGGIAVNEHMRTSDPNVYAAGDVTGHSMLAHTAVREAEVAVNIIRGEYDSMSYRAIPGVVYTNPEVAGVGETEESLAAQGTTYQALRLPMTYSGRFVAENEGATGLCKILVGEDDKILGVHLLGNYSSEIITTATLAVEQELTVEKWQRCVFPHPSVSEILKETLEVFEDQDL